MAGRMGQGALVRSIGSLFEHGPVSGLNDGELLDRFVARRDEAAFSALVTLHGPAVLGVCRRILRDPHDVEDAFQATFLVLVRRAGSIQNPHRLGPWLHGVARRVALRARADAARRQAQVHRMESFVSERKTEAEHAEVRGAIDEEVGRLPARYRDAVILCDLEGRSYADAARRLQCPLGTVQSRLARGRRKLRVGLTRRGFAPAAGGLAVADLIGESASAAVSISLREAAVRGAVATALGRSAMAGAVSATAAALMTGALRGMAVASLKTASTAVVLVMSILLGGGLLARGISADGPAPAVVEVPKPKPPVAAKKVAEKAVPGGVSLSGIVLRPGGRPVPKATVIIQPTPDRKAIVRLETDQEGRFQSGPVFDPKQHEVVVTAIAPGLAWTETMVMIGQPAMPPVTIRLTPRQPLHGRVVDPKGRPVKGAAIEPTSEFRGGKFDWKAVTDADGRFDWFEAPTLGTIVLNATKAPFAQALGRRFDGAGSREITITLHRPLHLHGTVTDSETGKPIERSKLVIGWGPDRDGGRPRWHHDSPNNKDLSGGRFDLTGGLFPDQGLRRSIRIEADGYLPGDLIGFRDDAEDVAHDFKLRPAKPLTGIVRGPDGKALSGADVGLCGPDDSVWVENGQVRARVLVGDGGFTKTDADGRYTFRPQAGRFIIVVGHHAGFDLRGSEDLARSADITVTPWGRIEGTLRIGSKPAPRQKVSAWVFSGRTNVGIDYKTETDAEGRFRFDRVVPGRLTVYRKVDDQDHGGWTSSNPVRIEVKPGQVARAEIGGTGRPVVGRLAIPEGVVLADFIAGHARLGSELKAPPYPDDFADLTDAERIDWWDTFMKTPEGQTYSEGIPEYAVAIGPDGRFRIVDVPAGRYILKLPFKGRTGDELPNRLAFAKAEVVVPEVPGGRSDEPLDIGAIPLAVFPLNRLSVGDRVPSIPDKAADGRPLGLDIHRGKFVLLAYWSTYDRLGVSDILDLKAVHAAHGRDPRLVMIGLSADLDPAASGRYAARHGLNWEQRYLGDSFLRDNPEPISASLGLLRVPQVLLIGPDGRLIAKDLHGEEIKTAVTDALKQPKG